MMGHLALGLIESCLEHYGQKGSVQMQMVDENGEQVEFTIELD